MRNSVIGRVLIGALALGLLVSTDGHAFEQPTGWGCDDDPPDPGCGKDEEGGGSGSEGGGGGGGGESCPAGYEWIDGACMEEEGEVIVVDGEAPSCPPGFEPTGPFGNCVPAGSGSEPSTPGHNDECGFGGCDSNGGGSPSNGGGDDAGPEACKTALCCSQRGGSSWTWDNQKRKCTTKKDPEKECEKCDVNFHFCKQETASFKQDCLDIGQEHADTMCEELTTQCNNKRIEGDYECKVRTLPSGEPKRTCTGPAILSCVDGCMTGHGTSSSTKGVSIKIPIPKLGEVEYSDHETVTWDSSTGFNGACVTLQTNLKFKCLEQKTACRSNVKKDTGRRCK